MIPVDGLCNSSTNLHICLMLDILLHNLHVMFLSVNANNSSHARTGPCFVGLYLKAVHFAHLHL